MREIAPRIVVDETIWSGKPIVKGTRVPISIVLSKLAEGMTYEKVIEEYGITRADILAVLDYAAKILSQSVEEKDLSRKEEDLRDLSHEEIKVKQ